MISISRWRRDQVEPSCMKTLARERDKAELLHRFKQLRPDSGRRWGRMSAHQMVCHLNDSFRMMAGDKLVSGGTSRLQRSIVKWIALYLPLSWPAGIPTRPEIDQEQGGTRPAAFAADLADWRRWWRKSRRPAGVTTVRIQSSAGCPRPPGSGGPTFTSTTICVNSGCSSRPVETG